VEVIDAANEELLVLAVDTSEFILPANEEDVVVNVLSTVVIVDDNDALVLFILLDNVSNLNAAEELLFTTVP